MNENELKLLTQEIEKIKNDRMKHLLLLLIATGLRFSEAVGLQFDDIDTINATVNIDKAYDYMVIHGYKPTKNETSTRTVKLDKRTNERMKHFITRQKKLAMQFQNNPDKLLFLGDTSKPLSHVAVTKALKKACRNASVKEIGIHGLRHTHASILLLHGVSIEYISERLGHSDTNTTRKFYLHVLEELKSISDNTMDEIFANF